VQEVRDSKDAVVGSLRDALKRPMLVGKEMTERDLAQREITIMADKSLPYEVLKKVMSTCTDADYGKVSLAVIQKEKPVAPGQFRPG
jgi:biopolymer transport protein ExbD